MEAVKNIGKVELKAMEERGEGLLEGFTEDVSGNGVYKNCLEIEIEEVLGEYRYLGINLRQYDSEYKCKYLYRSGSSRGTDITPTAKLTDLEKTFPNKIVKALPEAIKFAGKKYSQEKMHLQGIEKALNESFETIKKDLKEKLSQVPKREGAFVTITLIISGNKKYIGDFELFKEKVVSDALKKFHYSETNKKDVYKEKAVCSLCLKDTEDIYGLVGVFPFYTIDKIGYVSGGFDYEKAWRNYPVCRQCAIELELGKRYLDENLTFSFYQRKYYLIPKPVYNKSLPKILQKYLRLKSEDVKEVREKYSSVEEKVMKNLSQDENSISFDLMFFEKSNAALNILLNIEDVAPSRFRTIFNALDRIRRMGFFEDKQVSFELLSNVFTRDLYNRYFLEAIDKIISDGKLEYKFMMPFFDEYIIDAYKRYEKDEFDKDKDNYNTATFRVFGFLYFVHYLNLFKEREEEYSMMMDNKQWDIKNYGTKNELFKSFFEDAKPFFSSPDRRAVFLVGFITKKLLNIQYHSEKRKPFMARLKGLKLSSKDIKRLIPELQAKLIEYKSEYYNDVFQIVSEYLIESNGLQRLSDVDVPFYFSLGMNMDKNFVLSAGEDTSADEEAEII